MAVDYLERLAEARMQDAVAAGELDDLPGAGRPLVLDDDSMVPPELRVAYRILRNAGFAPPEVRLRREIDDVEALIAQAVTVEERGSHVRRLRALMLKLSLTGREGSLLDGDYQERIHRHFQCGDKTDDTA